MINSQGLAIRRHHLIFNWRFSFRVIPAKAGIQGRSAGVIISHHGLFSRLDYIPWIPGRQRRWQKLRCARNDKKTTFQGRLDNQGAQEHIKLDSSLFAGLLCPWLLQKHCGIFTNMPYVSSLPRTNPLRKNLNSQLFNALDKKSPAH